MVVRINGAPRQGVWFSADVAFVEVTAASTTYLTDLTVTTTDPRQADLINSDLEVALEILATRGNVIALNVVSDTVFTVMVDYGQAIDPLLGAGLGGGAATDIEAELEALIISESGATTAALVVSRGFGIATPGTPA